jgi:hemolysin D
MIRILLVDDQKSIRERLKSLLETEPDFDIVGMVDNGYDAIEQVKLLLPDVVLMDMEMPDIDGVLATKIISHSSLKTKVLVLSSHDSDEYVADSIYAGANGYILKGAPAQEIRDAVRFVNRGYMQIAPGLFEKFIPHKEQTSALEWKPKPARDRIPVSRIERGGGLELSQVKTNKALKSRSASGIAELEQPSELILDITALQKSRKSIGWYQAAALVLAGLGLTGSLYLLRQSLKKPAATPDRQDRAQQLHNLPFTGKIEPQHVTKIDATIPGTIAAVTVKVGQSVKSGDLLVTIRNTDAERTNQTKILQQQQLDTERQQALIQQATQQQQQFIQQQQLLLGEQKAAAGRIATIQLAIANYHQNILPLRQQVATANIRVNEITTGSERLPLSQKLESVNRAQSVYAQTASTYERLVQYQSEGAISIERVEQAKKDMTVAQSDLKIARSDYDSLVVASQVTATKQAAQSRSTQLQQQLALKEQAGQFQQLQSQLQVAQSDYQQIGVKLRQLQQQTAKSKVVNPISGKTPILEPTTVNINAPVAGMAIEIPVAVGDRIFVGSKLIGITNPQKLKLGVDLEPQQVALLKLGQSALVKFGTAIDSQELTALVTKIAPPIDRSTQHVEVEFTNPKPTIPIGQTGTVYFPK